ncbi:hypothetical protein NE590_15525 [Blautia obeum]|uniref:hypothetical protein n=1 Tax=Blautia obeum TaxID=40520 RepID=UPI00210AE6B1|nr:hypothetical protein [Blautia obeum]MCQ4791232.1 hypothetical protein [Blautia obeum]
MPDNKDELLKKQNEEIQKLKKELKAAAKPSSMFSVLKNTVKRNVHDFFIREDKMKTMDSKIKDLEKELAKKEEELNKTSAELFAVVNLGQNNSTESALQSDITNGDDISEKPHKDNKEDALLFPQTAEEAVREYFGPLDLTSLAKQKFSEPEPELEQKITAHEEKTLQSSECELLQSKTASQSDNINNDSLNEAVIEDTSPETVQKETSKNQSVSEPSVQKNKNNIMLNGDKKEEIQNDSVITPRPKAGVVTRLKMNLRSPSLSVSESGNEELCSELSPVLDERSRRSLRCCVDGVSDSPYTSSNLRTDGQPNCSGSDCLQHSSPDGKPGRGLPSIDDIKNNDIKHLSSSPPPQKKNIKTGDAKEPNTDKDNQKESIKKEKQESVPAQPQSQNLESQPAQQSNSKNPTATVVDKNGKRKSKKDKRKNQNKQASQVIIKQPAIQGVKKDEQRKENTTAAISIPEPSAEPEIELPDDFGIVIEPEEPELSDLPDINSSPSGETSVFDDLFNSDSDNWDDSNI